VSLRQVGEKRMEITKNLLNFFFGCRHRKLGPVRSSLYRFLRGKTYYYRQCWGCGHDQPYKRGEEIYGKARVR